MKTEFVSLVSEAYKVIVILGDGLIESSSKLASFFNSRVKQINNVEKSDLSTKTILVFCF